MNSHQHPSTAAALGYASAINAQDLDALIALFADDGELVHPFGVFAGRQKLAEFYGGLVMPAATKLTVTRTITEGNCCTLEVVGVSPQAPDKPQYAVDIFEVDGAGLITSLRIYYRNFDLR